MSRKGYPTDVSDEKWAFVAPYLTLMTKAAPQREQPLREVFKGLRYQVRGGISWRMIPNDLPPSYTVYQHTQRWLKAGSRPLRVTRCLSSHPRRSIKASGPAGGCIGNGAAPDATERTSYLTLSRRASLG